MFASAAKMAGRLAHNLVGVGGGGGNDKSPEELEQQRRANRRKYANFAARLRHVSTVESDLPSSFILKRGLTKIGRNAQVTDSMVKRHKDVKFLVKGKMDLVLDSTRTPKMISRLHVCITKHLTTTTKEFVNNPGGRVPDKWFLQDCKSVNGVFVNSIRVKEAVLQHGDIIIFGGSGADIIPMGATFEQPASEFIYRFENRFEVRQRGGDESPELLRVPTENEHAFEASPDQISQEAQGDVETPSKAAKENPNDATLDYGVLGLKDEADDEDGATLATTGEEEEEGATLEFTSNVGAEEGATQHMTDDPPDAEGATVDFPHSYLFEDDIATVETTGLDLGYSAGVSSTPAPRSLPRPRAPSRAKSQPSAIPSRKSSGRRVRKRARPSSPTAAATTTETGQADVPVGHQAPPNGVPVKRRAFVLSEEDLASEANTVGERGGTRVRKRVKRGGAAKKAESEAKAEEERAKEERRKLREEQQKNAKAELQRRRNQKMERLKAKQKEEEEKQEVSLKRKKSKPTGTTTVKTNTAKKPVKTATDEEVAEEEEDEPQSKVDPGSMTVAQLRVELRARDLLSTGLKRFLLKRLQKALAVED